MHLLPIVPPTNPSSDIFNGDQWLGLVVGVGTFFLSLWYFYAPSTLTLSILMYWIAIPIVLVSAVFFQKLYNKNIGNIPQASMLMPLIAIGFTMFFVLVIAWPVILSCSDFLLSGRDAIPRLVLPILPLAAPVMTWQVVKMLLPGKWWKQQYT